MPRGGARVGAGKKKGSINKATRALREQIAATGLTPMEVMLSNMQRAYEEAHKSEADITSEAVKGCEHDEILARVKRAVGYRQIAQNCAKDAAPYAHPRLATIEHGGPDGGPIMVGQVTDEDRAKALAVFLAKTNKGKSE